MAYTLEKAVSTVRRFTWRGEMSSDMCMAFEEDGYLIVED